MRSNMAGGATVTGGCETEGPPERGRGAEAEEKRGRGGGRAGAPTRGVPPSHQAPPAARRGEGERRERVRCRYLGTQLGLEPSISQVAKRFIGTGRPKAPAPPGKLRRPRSAAAAMAAGLACAHRAVAAGCAATAPPRRGVWSRESGQA